MGQEHLTVEREVVTLFDRVTCTETWQGTYADCKAKQRTASQLDYHALRKD